MASLNILSTEILERITSVITTSQQAYLWQCGDRILNIKLRNGGLKRTSLCWSGPRWMPWPRWYFATLDGIEDVKWSMDAGKSLCPALEFNLLPKTLKRLHLECDDVFLLLRDQNVKINALLPLLNSLHLSGSLLCEENLKNLPSNLIELFVASSKVCIKSSNIFSDLPRHIERLTLRFSIEDLSERENDLPSNLLSLTLPKRLVSKFNWFRKLPKSLKMLELGFLDFDPDWLALPSQLEKLKCSSYDYDFPKSALPQLPQALKTLELYHTHSNEVGDEIVTLIPKNLTRLRLPGLMAVYSSVLQQLPVSLTDFETIVYTDLPDVIALFPPGTTRISLLCPPEPGASESFKLYPFSNKLRYLSIPYINDEICAILPPGLEELHILSDQHSRITTKGASKLPKSLTSFNAYLEVFDNTRTMRCLGSIPKLGLWARLHHRNELSNWIPSLLPSCLPRSPNSGDLVETQGYNHHLTDLRFELRVYRTIINTSPFINKSVFDSLSKFPNLKSLQLYTRSYVSCDWLGLIPPTVTYLRISLYAFPTAAQLLLLPKCLIHLYLDVDTDCDWNDEVLQSLPRSLQVFWPMASFPNLTERMHEYLPPNLRNVRMESGPVDFEFKSPLDRFYHPDDKFPGYSRNDRRLLSPQLSPTPPSKSKDSTSSGYQGIPKGDLKQHRQTLVARLAKAENEVNSLKQQIEDVDSKIAAESSNDSSAPMIAELKEFLESDDIDWLTILSNFFCEENMTISSVRTYVKTPEFWEMVADKNLKLGPRLALLTLRKKLHLDN